MCIPNISRGFAYHGNRSQWYILYFGSVETLKYKPTKSVLRSLHVFLQAFGGPGTKLQCFLYPYRRYTYHQWYVCRDTHITRVHISLRHRSSLTDKTYYPHWLKLNSAIKTLSLSRNNIAIDLNRYQLASNRVPTSLTKLQCSKSIVICENRPQKTSGMLVFSFQPTSRAS